MLKRKNIFISPNEIVMQEIPTADIFTTKDGTVNRKAYSSFLSARNITWSASFKSSLLYKNASVNAWLSWPSE